MTEQSNVVPRSEYNDIKMKYLGVAQVLVEKHNAVVEQIRWTGMKPSSEITEQMEMIADDFNRISELYEMVPNGNGTFAIFEKSQAAEDE